MGVFANYPSFRLKAEERSGGRTLWLQQQEAERRQVQP
jgi:hypothetical protein